MTHVMDGAAEMDTVRTNDVDRVTTRDNKASVAATCRETQKGQMGTFTRAHWPIEAAPHWPLIKRPMLVRTVALELNHRRHTPEEEEGGSKEGQRLVLLTASQQKEN